jgi:LAT3 family solute carrier family 43 protein 3
MERRWLLYALAFVITSSVSGVGASPRRYRFPAAAPPSATRAHFDPSTRSPSFHHTLTAVYGWPALRRDLMREGGLTEKQLGAVFTCGAWSVQGGRFLVGLARDAYGTRVTACSCLILVVLGSTLVATCASDDFPGMCVGMLFLGMGSGAQLCVQPVTDLFPERASTAMATLSGAFQISGLVFLVCSGIGGAGAGRLGAYLTHVAFVAALFVVAARALPAGKSFQLEREEETDETEKIADARGAAREASPAPGEPRHFHKRSRRDLMMSDEYIGLLVWFSVVVTPSQYYVLSIGYQLEQKGDADGEYTRAFTLLYGFSAVFAPLGGAVADRFGVGFAQLVATVLTAASLFALLSPSLPLQIPGIAAYSVGRLFIFAMFFSNIGRRLGFVHYGALVGTGMLTSAAVSMLQYPLFTAGLEGRSALDAVNGGCAAAVTACVPYTAWLWKREMRERREGKAAAAHAAGGEKRIVDAEAQNVVASKEW